MCNEFIVLICYKKHHLVKIINRQARPLHNMRNAPDVLSWQAQTWQNLKCYSWRSSKLFNRVDIYLVFCGEMVCRHKL